MRRHRDVAGSPARTAAETWETVAGLIVSTLERSSNIDPDGVRGALDKVRDAGLALIAGGHLNRLNVTVLASPLYLTIGTVSGEAAFAALEEENLNPVPGAASAESWTIHLPRPNGLAPLIDEVVDGVEGVSTEEPGTSTETKNQSVLTIDLHRLDPNSRN